jgi:homeobox protein cut-like
MQGLENQLKEEQEVLLLKEAEVAKLRSDYDKQVKELLFNLNGLQNQLATMSDYEDLKKELKIIKDIEFVGVSPTMKSFTIEQLLAQKNKKLETELTTLKNKYEKTEAHSRTLESELGTYKKKVEEQSILVAKLENDLARMNQAPPAPVRPNHVSLF